jgi:hypothetical protein
MLPTSCSPRPTSWGSQRTMYEPIQWPVLVVRPWIHVSCVSPEILGANNLVTVRHSNWLTKDKFRRSNESPNSDILSMTHVLKRFKSRCNYYKSPDEPEKTARSSVRITWFTAWIIWPPPGGHFRTRPIRLHSWSNMRISVSNDDARTVSIDTRIALQTVVILQLN